MDVFFKARCCCSRATVLENNQSEMGHQSKKPQVGAQSSTNTIMSQGEKSEAMARQHRQHLWQTLG